MNEYELALSLFDKAVSVFDEGKNALLEKFCEEMNIKKTTLLASIFLGFLMGLDACAETINAIENAELESDPDTVNE